MANISSIGGNPIVPAAVQNDSVTNDMLKQTGGVLDDVEYLRQMFTNIDDCEILSGKYVSFSGSTASLYNVTNSGCMKIAVSDYVGQWLEVSAECMNTTYNLLYVIVGDEDAVLVSFKTTGVTSYDRARVFIPSDAKYVYVNFDYTGGTLRANVKRILRDEAREGTILSAYPLITYDAIAQTVTVDNTLDNIYFPAYLAYWDTYITINNGTTHLSQTFNSVSSGTLFYDYVSKAFVFTSSYSSSDDSNYIHIATFYGNRVVSGENSVRTIANDLKNGCRKLVCYGDSLTWYDGNQATWGPSQGTTIVGFESYLRKYLSMNVQNLGASGETIPQICARMANDSTARNCDMLCLMGGDNDDRNNVSVGTLLPQGSSFDTSTTIGAMQNAIETVLAANPTCVLFLATEPMGWKWNGSALERVDDVYPNAIRRVAELYGLPLLDLWNISGVNEMTRNTMYLDPPDTTNQQYMYHPNNYGWKVISERIIQFVQML